MWWAIGISLALSSVVGGVWFWSAKNARKLAQAKGELRGKLDAAEKEIRRLRGALLAQGALVEEMGRPDATPGDLAAVLRREAAGGDPGSA